MNGVFARLAAKLDELPHGFPPTESGVELCILEKIFSPEDAEMALHLLPIPEPVEAIVLRVRQPLESLRAALDGMAERGQILVLRRGGGKLYMLAPFVIGIYEFQLDRMDAELAALCEEYIPTLMRTVGGSGPALARVVPVNAHIQGHAEVLRTDDVRQMLSHARSFRVAPCICRRERALMGSPCSHTSETCLAFSNLDNAYDDMPPWGRAISRDEAFGVLDLAEREGLVHCTYNVQRDQMFVCNCCSCCCGFLRGVKEFGAPYLLVRSDYAAAIDPAGCSGCGECAARCPMDAVLEHDGLFVVAGERCIGCGSCSVACPTDAIALVPRPRSERTTPPKTLVTWAVKRSFHRHGLVRTVAQTGRLVASALRVKRVVPGT
ncbi:MAG: 4Fe-4S dicluster domain-containing protein [Acidobacteria bacterium]|nr:MAG: 4Fe-4S dicluster domain-containing protein [Acidobacteriota bacterium]